jgi:hypothetical protein
VVAVGPQRHPVLVIKVQAVFGANKNPEAHPKHKFETFAFVATVELIWAEAVDEQAAQFVLAVVHDTV